MLKYLLSLMLFMQLPLFAAVSEGETLEREFWSKVKNQQWNDLDKMIAPYYQAVLFDAVLNKDKDAALLKAAKISDFTLTNFNVTEGPGIQVVTYEIEVAETIEGKPITARANRLSVWQKNNNKWQMVAHANLIPVPPQAK